MSTTSESIGQAAAPTRRPRIREILASPKMLAIMGLGAASGFPNQITESVLQAWLKDFGVSNTDIGILTYVAIPYLLKAIWAPLLDRYPLPLLGRRRGWILFCQLAMAACIALFAIQNPANALMPVAICALAVVFFSASQDIVIDAWRTDVSKPEERGFAAAVNNLGYRPAAWIASALALVVAQAFGWRAAMLMLAAMMAAFAIVTWLAPEPEQRAVPPRTLTESVTQPLKELLGTPGTVGMIVLIMVFKIGDAFALKLFTPFMMDVGFDKTEIALVVKSVFTTSAIAGAVLGGIWMIRLGLFNSMMIFGVLQTASNLLYLVLAQAGRDYPLMVTAVALDNLAGAMGNIAVVALIMALCNVRFSAFQYALLSTFAMLPRYTLGYPAGWLADIGWDSYYIASFFMGLPGLVLLWILRDRVRQYDVQR